MAEGFDLQAKGFVELQNKFLKLADPKVIERIERKALNAAGTVILKELAARTPIRVSIGGKRSLPPGALLSKLQKKVVYPSDGTPPFVRVNFGKLTYIARFVDGGHMNIIGGRLKGGKLSLAGGRLARSHTPAHPFVRAAKEAAMNAAIAIYRAVMQEEINKVLGE